MYPRYVAGAMLLCLRPITFFSLRHKEGGLIPVLAGDGCDTVNGLDALPILAVLSE